MYGYGYDYGYADYDATSGALGASGNPVAIIGIIFLIALAILLLMIISSWKIYKKAGKKGWESIMPIYNIEVLLEIVELPAWYITLCHLPIVNIYAIFRIYIELAHRFGKSTGFGILTVFFSLICMPILAFGKNNVYNGSNSTSNVNNNGNNVEQPQFTSNNNTFVNPNVNASMENNPINNQNIQQPFMFNQNINTEINPISAAEQPNNGVVNQMNTIPTPVEIPQNIEPMTQEPMVTQTMVTNPQPIINQPENIFKYETPVPVVNEQPIQSNVEQNILQQPIPGVVTNIEPMMQNQNNNNQNM